VNSSPFILSTYLNWLPYKDSNWFLEFNCNVVQIKNVLLHPFLIFLFIYLKFFFCQVVLKLTKLCDYGIRYFQYNSKRSCPFWSDAGSCGLSECKVKRCSPEELPVGFQFSSDKSDCAANSTSDVVDATISADARLSLATWRAYDAAAINFCEPDGCVDCDFVDLSINPERHTGFSGKAAKKSGKLFIDPTRAGSNGPRTRITFFSVLCPASSRASTSI